MEAYHQTKSDAYVSSLSNIENATVNVFNVTSKVLYNEFKRKKQTVHSPQKKIKLKIRIFIWNGGEHKFALFRSQSNDGTN